MYERLQFKRIQKSFQTIRMRISVRKLEAREGGRIQSNKYTFLKFFTLLKKLHGTKITNTQQNR